MEDIYIYIYNFGLKLLNKEDTWQTPAWMEEC